MSTDSLLGFAYGLAVVWRWISEKRISEKILPHYYLEIGEVAAWQQQWISERIRHVLLVTSGGRELAVVCVFFPLNRSFYPSTTSTSSVRADSS